MSSSHPLLIITCGILLAGRAPVVQGQTLKAMEVIHSSWMALDGGSTAGFVGQNFQQLPACLHSNFTLIPAPAPAASRPQPESAHTAAVIYNDSGWLLALRFRADHDPARSGKTEIFLRSHNPDVPPRHLMILPADEHIPAMAPLDFGGAIVIPHRDRPNPSRPYLSETRLAAGFGPCGPLNREFKIMQTAAGERLITCFFRWKGFGTDLPFNLDSARQGIDWGIKIIRHGPDGASYVFGPSDAPFTEYATLSWPPFKATFRHAVYRNWVLFGLTHLAGQVNEGAGSYWEISAAEAAYGFRQPAAPTFQPREPASDRAFLAARLGPFLAANQKFLSMFAYSPEKSSPSFSLPENAKDDFFTKEVRRLFTYRGDLADLRRAYLLDCLLGREVKSDVKTPVPEKQTPAPVTWDSLDGGGGDQLKLDEEPLF